MMKFRLAAAAALVVASLGSNGSYAAILSESFSDGFINAVGSNGWVITNHSSPVGTETWFQGSGEWNALVGQQLDWAGVGFESGGPGGAEINNWLLTPSVSVPAGGSVSFYTRAGFGSTFPDALELRANPTGSTNVGSTAASFGDFTQLLVSINSSLVPGGYPDFWTQQTYTFSSAFSGRLGFRYHVPNGGPDGLNSDIIGIDELTVSDTAPVALAKTLSASLDTTNGVKTFRRPTVSGALSSVISAYDTYSFTSSVTGSLLISMTPTNGSQLDGFLLIYQNTFDPANPLSNLVGSVEDSGAGQAEVAEATLLAGRTYIVVGASLYDYSAADLMSRGPFTISVYGVGIAAAATAIAGDYNGDGFVDAADYTVWADNFGRTGTGLPGDGNKDGVVNAADYTIWADHFGQGTPPSGLAAVPEPTVAALLAPAALLLGRRRR